MTDVNRDKPIIQVFDEHGNFSIHVDDIRYSFDHGESVEDLVKVFEKLGFEATYEEAF